MRRWGRALCGALCRGRRRGALLHSFEGQGLVVPAVQRGLERWRRRPTEPRRAQDRLPVEAHPHPARANRHPRKLCPDSRASPAPAIHYMPRRDFVEGPRECTYPGRSAFSASSWRFACQRSHGSQNLLSFGLERRSSYRDWHDLLVAPERGAHLETARERRIARLIAISLGWMPSV